MRAFTSEAAAGAADLDLHRGGSAAAAAASIALLVLGHVAPAQVGTWRLTEADLATGTRTLSPGEVVEAIGGGAVLAEQSVGRDRAAGGWALRLTTGERVRGTPVALSDDAITVETPDFGRIDVPLDEAAALVLGEAAGEADDGGTSGERPASDEVLLANGDRLSGFVSGLEDGRLTVEADDGGPAEVALEDVRRLRFADTGVEPERPEAAARVLLADGSELAVGAFEAVAGGFRVVWRGREATLATADVLAAEPVDGAVAWLADLPPAGIEHAPYLTAASPPRAFAGMGGAEARDVVASSRTTIAYDLPPGGWDRLATAVSIDGDRPRGDAAVRVLVDGVAAFSRDSLTAADGVVPVSVDLPAGAATVTLVVDYGRLLDVQDRVRWHRPALVRGGG